MNRKERKGRAKKEKKKDSKADNLAFVACLSVFLCSSFALFASLRFILSPFLASAPRHAPALRRATRRGGSSVPGSDTRAPSPQSPSSAPTLRRPACRSGVGLGDLPVVPAGEDLLQLAQRLLAVVDAGRVGAFDPNESIPGLLANCSRKCGELVARRGDLDDINRRRLQRQDHRIAAQALRSHLYDHDALVVVAFAQVEPFDAAGIANRSPARSGTAACECGQEQRRRNHRAGSPHRR